MKYIVFDIETQNTFDEVGSPNAEDLDISVISVFDSVNQKIKSFLESEFEQMWPLFEQAEAIVGYNSDYFDIPLLNKYYLKTGRGDLKKMNSIDIMVGIKNSLGRRAKLDDIAEATLGKNKIAHGLEAVKWWKQGKIDEIKKYCEEDVLITDAIFQYAMQNNILKLKDQFGKIIEIKIDTSNWKPQEKQADTQSLF